MRHTGRFAVALVLCIGLASVATAATMLRGERDELPVGELLRVEPLPDAGSSPADDQLRFQFEVLGGIRQHTEDDLVERYTPEFATLFTAADLNAQADAIVADLGPVRFVRVRERGPELIRALGFDRTGEAGELRLVFADDGRIAGLDTIDAGTQRLPVWESTLILLGGWALIVAAGVAWRSRASHEAWTLLVASLPTLAALLVLSDWRLAYTAGRVGPSLVVVAATLLLLPDGGRARRWVAALAVFGAVVGALAPFVRDASLIGHPAVVGAFADDEMAYRTLLASSAALAAVVMAGVAAVNIGRIGGATGQLRPALRVAAAVAAVWSGAALGAAIDLGAGDGVLASGPLRAVTWSALVVVPAVVVFRLVSSQWARAELATLVIDLEARGDDLQPAIARALDDPTLQLLTSPDGERLVDDAGEVVEPGHVPDGRALSRIQSGPRLVGGLVHIATLQRDPARLEAVAAAAGMALEVRRLNQQIAAQLDEVDASRARILAASDAARRRVERDLHDGAQQRLVAVGLRLQRARRLAGSAGHDAVAGLIEEATRDVRDAIEEIRVVSRGAQPALLAERGLAAAVDALAERAPVPVEVDITDAPLPPVVERTAYYVVAEGLTNMAKHATATRAEVSITRRDGDARVAICDDGKGGAEMTAGSGLEGLNDRVAATGGIFRLSSGPEGTTLEATIPCG